MTPPKSPPSSRLRRLIHSVRFRLTLWFVVILALILGGFSLFIYFRQVQVLRAETTSRLTAQESLLANYYRAAFHSLVEREVEENEPGTPSMENLPLLQTYDMLAVLGPNDQVLQQSINFPTGALSNIYQAWLTAPNPTTPIAYTFSGEDPNGDYLFVVSYLEYEESAGGALLLGSPLDPSGQLPRLALSLGIVYALTLLVAFGGGYWLANQAMQPVQVITHTAREIGEHDLSRRLHLGSDDELGQLADTFDEMLTRLQTAFERQRQFTADASHELRTPLAVIELEASRALERSRSPEEYQSTLQTIQSENEWMGRLVNELLSLARMDSGKALLQNEKLNLKEVALEVVGRLAGLAHENKVALITGESGEAIVWADRTFLSHMLTNLVENGLKYAQGENAKVVVETGSQLRNGETWGWIRVTDNGPGIHAEHIPHLFDRFYRVDAARTQSREDLQATTSGSGLGLAIVQSIAAMFGGEVEVRSEVGSGATFTVWLPRAE